MNSSRGRTVLALAVVAMAAIAFTATSANAAMITVDGFTAMSANSATLTITFDASGSDKLVVVVTGEHGFNNTEGNCSGITYDGVALTQAVNRDPIESGTDVTYNDIWYLDSPATSTGEIIASVSSRGSMTVFGLSGTAAGVGATAISDPYSRSVDLTTTAANSLVIASFGMGGNGNTAVVQNVDADAPLIEATAVQTNVPSRPWDGHVTAYAQVPTAGPGTYSFSGGNQDGSHVIAAEFLVVPEPATMGLLAIGGLALLRRRRRA